MAIKQVFLLCPVSLALSGCGAYLHQPNLESATSQIQKDFDALSEPKYFAEQRSALESYASREERAVGESAAAIRDAIIIELVRPSSLTEAADRVELLAQAEGDLAALYGKVPTKEELDQLALIPRQIAELSYQERLNTGVLKDSIRLYLEKFDEVHEESNAGANQKAKPRSVDCSKVGAPPSDDSIPTDPLELAYYSVQYSCEELRKISSLRNGLEGAGSTLGEAKGALSELIDEITARRQAKLIAEGQAEALQVRVKRLAKSREQETGDQAALRNAIKELGQNITDAEPIAREAGLLALADIMEEATVVALKPDDVRADNGSLGARASVALGLLDASFGLADAYDAAPSTERGNSALIGLALAKHRLQMARLDAANEELQLDILEAQRAALLEQARHLSTTILLLKRHPSRLAGGLADFESIDDTEAQRAIVEALAAYSAAWNKGAIPYQVLKFRAQQANRMMALERATFAERDYRSAIKPAIDELAAYGRGGIKQEAILSLLGQLGIAGSILGDEN